MTHAVAQLSSPTNTPPTTHIGVDVLLQDLSTEQTPASLPPFQLTFVVARPIIREMLKLSRSESLIIGGATTKVNWNGGKLAGVCSVERSCNNTSTPMCVVG